MGCRFIIFSKNGAEVEATSRFDGPIHPMADLEMFFPMNFF